MKRRILAVLAILSVSSAMFAIDFETVFRDLDDPVEVVFVMDTTGSMGGAIAGVRDNVTGFASALADSGYGYRFGATTFGDGTNTWDFDTIAPGFNMTPDVAIFQAQVTATGATGGADSPETQIDGIYDAATFYDWTPGTLHVMIMFTNSGFHYPGDGSGYSDVTSGDLITLLIARGFLVYTSYGPCYATPGYPDPDSAYDLIADTTGGCSFVPLDARAVMDWHDIFEHVQGDIMQYYSLSTSITGLAGYDLDEIELGLLPEMTTFGPRTIDLSGPEYAGVDEIYIAWTMHLTGTPMTGSPYTITLRTTTDEFSDSGVLNYKTSMGIRDGVNTPEDLTISAYPNPFNSSCTINYSIKDDADVRIDVVDVSGRIVSTIEDRALTAGEYAATWEPKDISSGTYLIRMKSGGASRSTKVLYVK